MKDILVITSSVIIIALTSLILFTEILDTVTTCLKRRRMNKIRLGYKSGDEKADIELRKQYDYLNREVEKAEYTLNTATKKLEQFKIIYHSLEVTDAVDEGMFIKIPENADSLSYTYPDMTAKDGENRRIYFYGSEMDQLKKEIKFHED